MKTGFKDPIAPQHRKEMSAPWSCKQPPYDERTSCFIDVGTSYGVGHRTPVGHEGNAKQRVSTLPFGRVSTMEVDEEA